MTITSPGRAAHATPASLTREFEPEDRISVLARLWRAPLFAHALVLGFFLLIAMLAADPARLLNADEGAAAAQANELAEGRGWTMAHPLPEVDPDGHHFPIDLSARRDDSNEFAPFAKHPVYPAVIAAAMQVGGMPAAATISVLGTVGAACGAALISRRISPGLDRATLWGTGLLSPLLYFSFVMIAHAVGAALIALLVLAVLRFLERASGPRALTVAGLAGSAVLLRNEAVLFGVALAAMLLVGAVVSRERKPVVAAGAVLSGTVAMYLVDAWLASQALGGSAVDPFSISSDSVVADRLHAFKITVLLPLDGEPIAKLGNLLAVGLLVAGAIVIRRRPGEQAMVRALAVVAAGAAVVWILNDAVGVVSGLLFAFPLMTIGLVSLRKDDWRSPETLLLVGTCLLFALAVIATQYRHGGAGWGGRYFVIAAPVIVPVAVLGVQRLRSAFDATTARVWMVATAVVATVFVVVPLLSVRYAHMRDAALQEMMREATSEVAAGDGDSRPVVVSTNAAAGRFSWRLVAEQRWLSAEQGDLSELASRLRDANIDRFVLLSDDLDGSITAVAETYQPVGAAHVGRTEFPTVGRQTLALSAHVMEARP